MKFLHGAQVEVFRPTVMEFWHWLGAWQLAVAMRRFRSREKVKERGIWYHGTCFGFKVLDLENPIVSRCVEQ